MDSIKAFCNYLYSSTFLPIQYYCSDQPVLLLPEMEEFNPTETFRALLSKEEEPLAYLQTKSYAFYGLVQNKEKGIQIFIGPVLSTPINRRELPAFLTEAVVSPRYTEEVWNFLSTVPVTSFYQFTNFLALIHQIVNGEQIDPNQYFLHAGEEYQEHMAQEHSASLYETKENESFHNTYLYERELYSCVERGDLPGLKRLLDVPYNFKTGTVAGNTLRQHQNIFISTITLFARHSMAGGLDLETAYTLADVYIREVEKLNDIAAINHLSTTALMDFTNRVAESKIPNDMSPDIHKALQYITTHTNTTIRLQDVAENVGISPSYLSLKFKKELGFNVSDFIMRAKLEEAKGLLAFSDKSISEISSYLCFSSQSYFQNVFKKKYQMTPVQYRSQQYRKNDSQH